MTEFSDIRCNHLGVWYRAKRVTELLENMSEEEVLLLEYTVKAYLFLLKPGDNISFAEFATRIRAYSEHPRSLCCADLLDTLSQPIGA